MAMSEKELERQCVAVTNEASLLGMPKSIDGDDEMCWYLSIPAPSAPELVHARRLLASMTHPRHRMFRTTHLEPSLGLARQHAKQR